MAMVALSNSGLKARIGDCQRLYPCRHDCVGVMGLCFGWELATGDGAIPEAGNKGGRRKWRSDQAKLTTEEQATASFSRRNEHARSTASSMGVGVRGDTERRACWFRRISDQWWLEARADAQATKITAVRGVLLA